MISLTSAFFPDYPSYTSANSEAEFCSSDVRRTTAAVRFFYVRNIDRHPFMGGSCGRGKPLPVLTRSANPHESAHPFCSGRAENLNRFVRR